MRWAGRTDDDLGSDDPSPEDIERFSGERSRRCGECGCPVHELAEICPKCHAYIVEDERQGSTRSGVLGRRFLKLVAVLVVLALSGLLALILR